MFFVLLWLFLIFVRPTTPASAFEASSTSFYVRQDMANIAGKSTSTSFWLFNNGSQTGLGLSSSTTFQIISGIIRSLFQPIAPNYTLIHYHWRNDDGTETTATSATGGTQDTALSSITQNTSKRLRVEITNAGGTIKSFSAQQFRLEQAASSTTCAAISTWSDLGSATGTWAMATTTNLTNGTDTTNIATSTNGSVTDANRTFVTPNGGVRTSSSTTGNVSVPSDSFVELEYSVKPLASSTANGIYCFRVTNAGSPTNFTYTQYPQATVVATASQSISLVISTTTVNLPGLSPGSAVTATSTATVTISGGTNGYNLQISRNSSTSTIASSTLTFPDLTSWNSGSGCTAGQGNGTTAPGQTLSFRVQQANTSSSNYCAVWWGASDTAGTAIYAGMPTSTQTIVNASSTNNGTTATYILYRADAPTSQEATNYTGGITITALANP